jgi:pyridoxamine 5'-phosphate oxidase
MLDLETIRREYLMGGLRRESLADSPFDQFERWMSEAISSRIPDPTAMCLATVDAQHRPHQRFVLLKQSSPQGLVFFTNLNSAKAQHINGNQYVSLHFPWHMMERQVRVEGVAVKLSVREALAYFITRPVESQLAAWASPQSQPISSRSLLLQQFQAMKEKFKQGSIPLPDFWGGFRVVPDRFEFWQGGANRLHDRFQYQLEQNEEPTHAAATWKIDRLAP